MALAIDFLLLAADGGVPAEALSSRIQERVLSSCPRCRRERAAAGEPPPTLPRLPPRPLDDGGPRGDDPHLYSDAGLQRRADHLSRVREARRQATGEMKHLLALSPEDRPAALERARVSCRSRALVETLLAECRRTARSAPADAVELARLAEQVVAVGRREEQRTWHRGLALLADAHLANAHRVQGDLAAAKRTFGAVRQGLSTGRILEANLLADILSLEASLFIDQRLLALADEALEQASHLYRQAGDPPGEARVLVQRANLAQTRGAPEAALTWLEQASTAVTADGDPYLYLCTLTGRLNALADLARYGEAEELLQSSAGLYHDHPDAFPGAILQLLAGRIALGLQRHDEAEEHLLASQQALLGLDRSYDAALAALYRAELYSATGRHAELEELARELLHAFRARQVERETLATLFLLAEAATARQVTADLLRTLRDRLVTAGSGTASPPRDDPGPS